MGQLRLMKIVRNVKGQVELMFINKRFDGYVNTDNVDILDIVKKADGWLIIAYFPDERSIEIDFLDTEEAAVDSLNELVISINAMQGEGEVR